MENVMTFTCKKNVMTFNLNKMPCVFVWLPLYPPPPLFLASQMLSPIGTEPIDL